MTTLFDNIDNLDVKDELDLIIQDFNEKEIKWQEWFKNPIKPDYKKKGS